MGAKERLRGVVVEFDPRKGFGFIESTAGRVFLHRKACGGVRVEPGDLLEFSLYQAGQGLSAEHIHRLIESTALFGHQGR